LRFCASIDALGKCIHIENLDYSERLIGHAGPTCYRKKEYEKIEIFRKIEPYLTFLNVYQLERQGADTQSKIDELELLNQSLRERDKSKDDSILLHYC